jgi:SAM-dependent methyltransferase
MDVLRQHPEEPAFRRAMMEFLNGYGLDAAAILGLTRRAHPVQFAAGETVVQQGTAMDHVFFLVQGRLIVRLDSPTERRILGEREAVTLLGEISFFNGTSATATVEVSGGAPAVLMRIPYARFGEVIDEFPSVRTTLVRIGEMRMISQFNGFIRFNYFMEMIGWKRDRLAVHRAVYPVLEQTIRTVLLPRMKPGHRILEVGDGPGVVSELLAELRPDLLPSLHLQATYLEEAIASPFVPRPSDLTRATYLRERFQFIVALQVFNTVPPNRITEQLQIARRLLLRDGRLLVLKLRVLSLQYPSGSADSSLLYRDLEDLMARVWPAIAVTGPLVQITFLDADLDPTMEWNPEFRVKVAAGEVELPKGLDSAERAMLSIIIRQARLRQFNPDEVQFHWLAWNAAKHGFRLEHSQQLPETGYFHMLLQLL